MDRATPTPRSRFNIAFSFLALLAATVLAYAEWVALPGFRPLFDSFGGDIPWLSRWVVENPKGVWNSLRSLLIQNFTVLCVWLFIRERWTSIGLGLATAFTWLALALVLIAFYLPLLTIAV